MSLLPPFFSGLDSMSGQIYILCASLALERLGRDPHDLHAWKLHVILPQLLLSPVPVGHGVTPVIRSRCQLFLEGAWDQLFGDVQMSDRHVSSVDSEQRVVSDVMKLVKAGELRRAAQRLECSQVAPANRDTLELLRRLHPSGDSVPSLPASEIDRLSGLAIDLRREDFDAVLKKLPSASAPGPSYWRWEHIRVLAHSAANGDALFSLCCQLAKGSVPEEVRTYLAGARLVAFLKDPGGDRTKIRPLAAGEVFRKLVGKVICRQLAGDFSAHFCGEVEPGQSSVAAQLGVAVRSGSEVMVHTIQASLEANPEWVDISMDIKNAFNTVHRSSMFQEVVATFPQLYAFTKLCYGCSPVLQFRMQGGGEVEYGEVLSCEGAQQGDPLGPLYYALAMHPVIKQVAREYPSCLAVALLDDAHILGPAGDAFGAYGRFLQLARERGGEVVPAKSLVYSPRGDVSVFPEGMALNRDTGLRHTFSPVLKVPVSLDDEVVRSGLDGIIDGQQRLLRELGRVPCLQSRSLLLFYCAHPRVGYWTRTVLPRLLSGAAAMYDAAVREAWQQMHPGAPLGELALKAVELVGGLTPSSRVSPAAYLSSWYACGPTMRMAFPILMQMVGSFSSSVLPSLVALQNADFMVGGAFYRIEMSVEHGEQLPYWSPDAQLFSALREEGPGVNKPPQRVHAKALLTEDWMSVRSSLGPQETCWWDSLTLGRLGLRFLRTIPSHPGVRMCSEDFHIASRWFQGAHQPIVGRNRQCSDCGASVDPVGSHLLSCRGGSGSGGGNYYTYIHHRLRNEVCLMARSAFPLADVRLED